MLIMESLSQTEANSLALIAWRPAQQLEIKPDTSVPTFCIALSLDLWEWHWEKHWADALLGRVKFDNIKVQKNYISGTYWLARVLNAFLFCYLSSCHKEWGVKIMKSIFPTAYERKGMTSKHPSCQLLSREMNYHELFSPLKVISHNPLGMNKCFFFHVEQKHYHC